MSFVAPTALTSPVVNYLYSLSTNGGLSYSAYIPMNPMSSATVVNISGLALKQYFVKLLPQNKYGVGSVESVPINFSTFLSVDYLVVGAGGGGGEDISGGGGGGK